MKSSLKLFLKTALSGVFRAKFTLLIVLPLAAALAISFNNCENVSLSRMDNITQSSSMAAQNRVTLAVRGASCLLCHAQVKGDIVTDFGFGQSYFLTQRKYAMNLGGQDWQTLGVSGNIIVPKLNITRDGNNNLRTPVQTFKQMLDGYIPFASGTDLSVAGVRGSVQERSDVFIGTPNPDVIANLSRLPNAVLAFADWDVSVYSVGTQSGISGLVSVQAANGNNYITNGPNGISCTGDIVILGPVLLDNLNVQTDSINGCRLYVSKSVFIQGAVTYNNSTGVYPNLQISSARTIMLGIKGAKTRLESSGEGFAGIRQATTDATEKTFNQGIYDDRDTMIDKLVDAGPWRACVGTSGRYIGSYDEGTLTEHWEYLDNDLRQTAPYDCSGSDWTLKVSPALKKQYTQSVNFEHLYLNAPKVHSRYLGVFKGVVVAEDAIFALQEFEFQNDETFANVPVLPLMAGRVLRVSDQ